MGHVGLGLLLGSMDAAMAVEEVTSSEPLSADGTGELPHIFV
jgi:hypothetical protein